MKKIRRLADLRSAGEAALPFGRARRHAPFAGTIEAVEAGRLRGWICDPSRLSAATALSVFLDKVFVATVLADLDRPDLAAEPALEGCIGFDVALDALAAPETVGKSLTVHVADRLDFVAGPFLVPPEASVVADDEREVALMERLEALRAGARANHAHIFEHINIIHDEARGRHRQTIKHLDIAQERATVRFDHIFSHITATFEETRQRLDHIFSHVTAVYEATAGRFDDLKGSLARLSGSSTLLAHSAIAGVGRFANDEAPADLEQTIFTVRLKAAILQSGEARTPAHR